LGKSTSKSAPRWHDKQFLDVPLGQNHLINARSGHGADVLGGKVYIVGGRDAFGVLSSLEVMNLGWEAKAPPPDVLQDFRAVSLGDKIYVMGGARLVDGVNQNSNLVYEYDALNDTWTVKDTRMPFFAREFSLIAAYGKIYLIGGRTSATAGGTFTVSNRIFEYDPRSDTWVQKATMGVARFNAGTALYNGRIYIIGGRDNSWAALATVEAFDPVANTIALRANLPQASSNPFACVLDGTLYVFTPFNLRYFKYGDTGSWSQLNADGSFFGELFIVLNDSLYALDFRFQGIVPRYQKFSHHDNMWHYFLTFNFYGNVEAVVDLGNRAYMFTGNSTHTTGLAVYTPPASAWTNKAGMCSFKYGHAAATLNDEIFVVGGVSYWDGTQTSYHNTLEKYNESNDTWERLRGMAHARSGLGLASANGRLYAIGGRNFATALAIVEEYNPATNTWAARTPIPVATTQMAIASHNNLIYIFGGRNAGGNPMSTTRIFNPATNTWAQGANMPIFRFGAGAAVIDGKIYVVGGFTSEGVATNVLHVYNPATNTWDTSRKPLPRPVGFSGVVAANSLYL